MAFRPPARLVAQEAEAAPERGSNNARVELFRNWTTLVNVVGADFAVQVDACVRHDDGPRDPRSPRRRQQVERLVAQGWAV